MSLSHWKGIEVVLTVIGASSFPNGSRQKPEMKPGWTDDAEHGWTQWKSGNLLWLSPWVQAQAWGIANWQSNVGKMIFMIQPFRGFLDASGARKQFLFFSFSSLYALRACLLSCWHYVIYSTCTKFPCQPSRDKLYIQVLHQNVRVFLNLACFGL